MEIMDYQHLTEDRSLGLVELHVSDLACESPADSQYRYESTGAREVAEPIKIDGNTCKGHLHYRVEFVLALNLKHVHFDADENEIQKAAHEVQHNHENDSSGTTNSRTFVLLTEQANQIRSPSSLSTARRRSRVKPRRKLSTLIGQKISKSMCHLERRQTFPSKFSIGINLSNLRVLGVVPLICVDSSR